jgi:hypothetical protein
MGTQRIVMCRGRNFIASFDSFDEASRIMQIDQVSIEKACAGEEKEAGPYKWAYERRNKKRKNPSYF